MELAHQEPWVRLSVVIPNYNYQCFVGAAIESALGIDWPSVEIIVVDDGSTDNSRQVISSYEAGGVRAIYKQNGGPASAADRGFAESSGDLILFLDSDDTVDPSIMRELIGHFGPGISKVQFQMRTITAQGQPDGNVFPKFTRTISPDRITDWARIIGTYPTPPGSGNVYTREFLSKIFPLDLSIDRASDSFCLAAAPFLGKVVTVAKPLVSYRIHGQNIGAMDTIGDARFGRELTRALAMVDYGSRSAASVDIPTERSRGLLSLRLLSLRCGSYRTRPESHPVEGESRGMLLLCLLRAGLRPQGYSGLHHATLVIWLFIVIVAPRRLVMRLLEWRFVPAKRPKLVPLRSRNRDGR